MNPRRLTLENFRSYKGEHVLDLAGVNLMVLSGHNGAGKSTLIEAIRFALYGHAAGGLDAVIRHGEERCRVEFAFDLGEDTYLVSRQRSSRGSGTTLLSFQMSNADGAAILDGKTATETQTKIEGVLGMDDDLFAVTACASQGNAAAFSQAKPAQRKDVLAEILDLEAWERRAKRGRQVHADLSAQTEAGRARLSELLEQANQIEIIAAEIARLLAEQRQREEAIAAKESELSEAQEARANIVRDQEADRARRAELADVEKRLRTLDQVIGEAATRARGLRQAAAGKPKIVADLTVAEGAQTAAQEMEATRQEDVKLQHQAELAQQEYVAALNEHKREIENLTRRVGDGKRAHARDIEALTERIRGLRRQTEVLEKVPCTRLPDIGPDCDAVTDHFMTNRCPLLAQAHEASEKLIGLDDQVNHLGEEHPWAEDEGRLKHLLSLAPGAEQKAAVADLAKWRAALGYDAKAHGEVKTKATAGAKLRDALSAAERAEAQALEVENGLAGRQVDREDLEATRGNLARDLGPLARWDDLLAATGRQIGAVQTALGGLQQSLRLIEQQRGGGELQLSQAKRAREQAAELADELSASDRRLRALKILVEACSKAGIPALLIERAVPDLETAANEVLSLLSDGRMALRLRSQHETKTGSLQETLDIIVADESGEWPYEGYSGGERMNVDLAIRVALSTLLAHRAGARCELLVLDETAAPLDDNGRLLFVESLQRVADRFGCILVATHVAELKDLFPFRCEVTKDADGSHAEVIAA
jgi:exonuclease SbcC